MSGKSNLDAGRNWPHWMIGFWISLCALLQVAGWGLSAVGQLNAAGYVSVLGAAAVVAILFYRNRIAALRLSALHLQKLVRRFGRPLPLGFLVLAALAILGGLLYAPSNYDGLAYRVPRTLHWLAENRWHWISTDFARMNTRGCGWEWVAAPVLAVLKTDRPLFVFNAISFLLLPGLTFSVLHRLGVRSRVAWHWMWLLPTGYCYLLQAGSIGNDLFGATFALAAMYYALRARQTGGASDVRLSVLAAALATGTKSSNLLLGLPWLVAIAPALKHLWTPRLLAPVLAAVALLCSAIPISVLNWRHCGDWSGQALEGGAMSGAPALRLLVNSLWIAQQNFAPPIFPFASHWNAAVKNTLPIEWRARLESLFEPGAAGFHLGEMASEEGAALGFGVSALLVVSWVATARRRAALSLRPALPLRGWPFWVVPAAWMAVFLFMSQSGLSAITRLLSPFYFLLAVPFLRSAGQESLVCTRLWRAGAWAVFALGAVLLVINPARPLWPAIPVLRAFGAEQSSHPLVQRAWTVYSVYHARPRAFEPVL
ncbi:MAG: hypothetical protein RMK20_02325, partial [Verrucomicrobiales bacterium]|nr:hypothetical protein [Verrucomicrobiales bacterium]